MVNIFLEIALILVIATLVSIIMRIVKQPLIIGYIITGIIVSPFFLDVIKTSEIFNALAQIGIAFLLFLVGLNLNYKVVKEVGLVSLVTGMGQVIFTSIIGYFISLLLGFTPIESFYIAVALTFSSTIIIVKLLSDKGDLEKLYGKISIGFLLVQDLIAILILILISSFYSTLGGASAILFTIIKGLVFIISLFLIADYVLPPLLNYISRSQELLFLFSVSWALILAAIVYYLGFSMEIGALLAGISLSTSRYHWEISAKIRPLRDFFIIVFFIFLGSQMTFSSLENLLVPALIFSVFILIGNPLIVMALMGVLGYSKRNGFLAGLTVAQISEFSLILVILGMNVGHLSQEIVSLVTIVGVITIAGSAYMITNSEKLYHVFSKYLRIFEKKNIKQDKYLMHKVKSYEILLLGYNRIGYSLLESFKKIKSNVLVIDHNPEVIKELEDKKINCIYGDVSDLEFLDELNYSNVKMVVSTVPDLEISIDLVEKINSINKKIIVIVTAHQIEDALKLYEEGATYVILPHFLGGEHVSHLISKFKFNYDKFFTEKINHINEIEKRKDMGHEHPKHYT